MGVVKSHTVAAVKSPVYWTTTNYFLFHSTLSKVTWCPDATKKKSVTTTQHVFQQSFTLNAVYSLIIILKNHITQAPITEENSVCIWLPAALLGTTFKLLVST